MVSEARRGEVRQFYRMRRIAVNKTQLEVETLARLDAGKFWKIENGFYFPDEDERSRLARVLKCDEADLPSTARAEAKAS